MSDSVQPPSPQQQPLKLCVQPKQGEAITSVATNNTYTMGEKLGEGNFGIVYSCTDVWRNELAVKVLKPRAAYETVRASAESEIYKLVALRHPNITYVYDAFEYRDTFYIVTEKCNGPLSDLFSINGFDGFTCLIPIARCLLQAVHYLHVSKYVHQDIHPGNVFTSIIKNEMPVPATVIQFKLGDLGVAKLAHEVNAENTRAEWMRPPEVLRPLEFGEVDYRIDIYHIGLLFLQLAYSKELRFSADEILAGKPRDLALGLLPPFSFALEKALRRHVAARTASAMELWRDLQVVPSALPPAGKALT